MINSISSYVEGLFKMASSLSKNMGPSYINASIYSKDTFIEKFSKNYQIDKKYLNLFPTKRSLEDVLHEWLNDKKIEESLIYWLETEIGKNIKTLSSDDARIIDVLSGSENGLSGFYTLEDIYFIEYDEFYLVLMLGNNE